MLIQHLPWQQGVPPPPLATCMRMTELVPFRPPSEPPRYDSKQPASKHYYNIHHYTFLWYRQALVQAKGHMSSTKTTKGRQKHSRPCSLKHMLPIREVKDTK